MRIRSGHPSASIVFCLLLALATYLYAIVVADALEALRGAISKGAAFELVFTTVALWVVLAILLGMSGRKGRMPRWAMRLALVAIPLSALSAFVAMTMIWAPRRWPIVFPVCLPVSIAFYAIWMQIPQLDNVISPRCVSIVAMGLILIMSSMPLLVFAGHLAFFG